MYPQLENSHLAQQWRCLLLPGSAGCTVTDYYTSLSSLYNMPTHSKVLHSFHYSISQWYAPASEKDTGKLSWEIRGWRLRTTGDCKLTKGGSLPCQWKKNGDWGSLIHDSNEMSQAVESQRQSIPGLRLHYSFHHKSDGSKGEQGHKWLSLVMGKLVVSRCHWSRSITRVLITVWE